jgi:hypothetical protein
MKIINIDQLAEYSRISVNIDRRQYEPIIKLAVVTDLLPLVGPSMVELIDALPMGGVDAPELRAFHSGFIVPFMAKTVELRMLVEHGANWGREGIVQFQDSQNTSAPVSDAMRANMIKQVRSDKSVFQTYLQNRFAEVGGVFDSVQFEAAENTRPAQVVTGTIQAIGKGRTSRARRYE